MCILLENAYMYDILYSLTVHVPHKLSVKGGMIVFSYL
jgi:hypothetical protein